MSQSRAGAPHIEDEKRLAGNIARSLPDSAGYAVDCAYEGEEGLYMAEWPDRRCCNCWPSL